VRNGSPSRRRRSLRNCPGVRRFREYHAAIPATHIITGIIQIYSKDTTRDAIRVVNSPWDLLVMSCCPENILAV